MSTRISSAVDFAALKQKTLGQFLNLDPNRPWTWASLPQNALFFSVVLVVATILWFVWLANYDLELTAERGKEAQLRQEYKTRLSKAADLEALAEQRAQVLLYVNQLEKQLPSKAEMDALLSDINQAGLGRSLQFDFFRPGQVIVREYYAELPIAVKVTGRYHDIGAFAADIARLSRIVTLNNLIIMPGRDAGTLTMDATAKTFRYLDAEEVQAQRKAARGANQ
jgi:type IV pilus assembly protein PilO